MFAVYIMGPGEVLLLLGIGAGVLVHYGRRYLDNTPEAKEAVKQAAARKTASLLAKWLGGK